ncbi:MAG: DUF2237 family protein, partial [Betaproteobacteria bacterium]|nr:DUF2237 family protein [Betaproteobacteria bacterium]
MHGSINVLGTPLMACSYDPVTGFFRDGCCETGPQDLGSHTVCCKVTEAFLSFSRSVGNDLSTPLPQYRFPGLKAGDRIVLRSIERICYIIPHVTFNRRFHKFTTAPRLTRR